MITALEMFSRLIPALWLRPERALWDAHELAAVGNMLVPRFTHPALEYGCTDGVNSFVLLGGLLPFEFDDYADLAADTAHSQNFTFKPESSSADYFDGTLSDALICVEKQPEHYFDVGVSWRRSHLTKARRLNIYRELIEVPLDQPLHIQLGLRAFSTIWSPNLYWTSQNNLSPLLQSHASMLASNGKIYTIMPDQLQIEHQYLASLSYLPKDWLAFVDRGISKNLTANARSFSEWQQLFQSCNLKITDHKTFLPSAAGNIYQIGFRPMYEVFLTMYQMLKKSSPTDWLDLKHHWVEVISHFMEPLCDDKWQTQAGFPKLWHLFELAHAE